METRDISELIAAAQGPIRVELDAEHAFVMRPDGWVIQDISDMMPPTDRIDQTVVCLTREAFTAYVSKFRTPSTAIFADEVGGKYEAVLDYHKADGCTRGESEHVVRYECPHSDPWKAWLAQSGVKMQMSQDAFGRFVEDNLVDVYSPKPADFLKLLLTLQIKKSVEFSSDIRLENGQTQLTYNETVKGTSDKKRGEIEIPDVFVLRIPIVVDGAVFEVRCRLRYRLSNGTLVLWYEIERAAETFRNAIRKVSEEIRKDLKDVAFWAAKRA